MVPSTLMNTSGGGAGGGDGGGGGVLGGGDEGGLCGHAQNQPDTHGKVWKRAERTCGKNAQ